MPLHTSPAARRKDYLLAAYLITLSASLFFLIMAATQGVRAYRLSTDGIRTTGWVRSAEADHIAEDHFFRYVIEFFDQTQQRHALQHQSEPDTQDYFLNQPVPIVYLPALADEALIDNRMNRYGTCLLNFLGFLTTLGMGLHFHYQNKQQ
jgi:hypothetical protein